MPDVVKASNIQIAGSHYKNLAIQPHEYNFRNNLNFHQGCIVKYITRYKDKGGKQDLEKIKHFVDLLIELEYPDYQQALKFHE